MLDSKGNYRSGVFSVSVMGRNNVVYTLTMHVKDIYGVLIPAGDKVRSELSLRDGNCYNLVDKKEAITVQDILVRYNEIQDVLLIQSFNMQSIHHDAELSRFEQKDAALDKDDVVISH